MQKRGVSVPLFCINVATRKEKSYLRREIQKHDYAKER